jgi:hypothetical protein
MLKDRRKKEVGYLSAMLADGMTAVRSVPRGFGISRLRRQLFKEYTMSCVLERRLIFGRLPHRVIRVGLTVGQPLPIFPRQRTFLDRPGWSVSCT